MNLEGYRRLFDSLPERALIINDRCEIVDVNTALLEELNQMHDSVVGRLCHEFAPFCEQRCDDPRNPCPGKKALDTGARSSEMRTYRDARGIKHYLEVTASPLLDPKGHVHAVLETRREINAERHLESTLTAIYHLGQELVLTRDEAQIAQAVVNTTRQTLNFQICALLLIENGDLFIAASAGYGSSIQDIRLPLDGDHGITVAVAKSSGPLYVPDVTRDDRFFATEGFEIRSELAVPLKVGDRVIGVLNVESDRLDAFDAIDQQLLATLADVAAVALESARAYRAEQQRASELAALHKLGLALVTEHDPSTIANRIFVELGDLLGIETAVVSIVNQPLEELILYGVDKGQPIPLQKLPLNGLSLSSHVVRTGKPLLIADTSRDELPVPGVQLGDRTSSWLGVPLRVENRIIGLVNIQSYTPSVFGPAELRLLTQIAAQVAPVLENAWLYQQTRQRMSELETLFSVTASVSSDLSLAHLLPIVAQELVAATGVACCVISEWDAGARTITSIVQHIEPDRTPPDYQAGDLSQPYTLIELPATEAALLNQESLVVYADDQESHAVEHSRLQAQGWAGMLALPMIAQGSILGLVQLYDDRPEKRFVGRDIRLAKAMADQAAVAIQRAKLFQAERQQRQETAAINRITRGLATGLSLRHLFQSFVRDLGDLVRFERVSIALLDDPDKPTSFRMHVVHDDSSTALEAGTLLPISATAAAADVLSGQPHLTLDLADEVGYPAERALYDGGLRSRVNLPLLARGRIIGALNLVSRETGAYRPSQLPVLQQAADAVAAAVENAQLYQALEEHASQLEDQVRRRTAELQAERDRTQAILDSAAEGVIVTDLHGSIEYMNPAAEELTGFSRDEALGQNARLWQSGHIPREVYAEMWQTILAGGTWEGELINRRRDGNCYDALLTIAPIPGPSGEPVGFVGMQQDISERKELDRLKDLFVSNVSHELRTPLTNLKLYLKLMDKGRPEKRTQYLATLEREANRLQQLIEDLLSLSRLDAGRAVPTHTRTDLNRLVSQLVSDRRALADEKGLTLSTDLAPDLAPVMADEKMLAQVLTNLTTNAMNYTSAGGRIMVRTALQATDGPQPADWATVSVIDTGYGVLPEEKQLLFERFYRGEAARRAGAPGTGLGLAICREIIARHEGHITVESELGKGSTFTVWLPSKTELP